jgi:hypothetical protein
MACVFRPILTTHFDCHHPDDHCGSRRKSKRISEEVVSIAPSPFDLVVINGEVGECRR